ncbi:hypothetical protein PYV00_11140 [Novosphingobium sp. H3SJ31-1]|uniref:Uncharacterized protein n=1 Tax=Novosphingobium album (ex Liu et al. 2023) TaxID=3031130 RepID=A0ABT5WQF3_9SPHN|nr:hypothetical protein [Novosphingobium album (ex Liu et al. 2023)]MDE8652268.1 hypothetical protein [Novosphingobium album (ex Liu et al. 2023)]
MRPRIDASAIDTLARHLRVRGFARHRRSAIDECLVEFDQGMNQFTPDSLLGKTEPGRNGGIVKVIAAAEHEDMPWEGLETCDDLGDPRLSEDMVWRITGQEPATNPDVIADVRIILAPDRAICRPKPLHCRSHIRW